MEFWRDVRRQVLTGELSHRGACRKYGLGWHTLKKILSHEEPPGYRQSEPRPKRKLKPFLPIIHQILAGDRQAPKKQRHTAKRIFERLRDEHGYQGGQTVVKDAVRAWKQSRQEVFLPLSHPPGEAQVDFGEATIRLAGQETKVALFVMTLPYSGAISIQVFPRECTETFLEGHRRAFEFFGGVPKRISYDNSAIAVIKVLSGRERKLTREFLRLQSHYLFREHFCLARAAQDNADHLAFLLQLCELELIERERKSAERRLKAARFPAHKLLDEFDFAARPSINKPQMLELVKGEYLDRRENVLFVGPSGTGKSHLATALGMAACAQGRKVRFFRVTELITLLLEAKEERQLLRLRHQLGKLDLLILDELGYVPASKAGAELLFDVIASAYERNSLIVTTNLPFENWTEVLGSERLTGAALDRLTHRCHILETKGESFRLQDAKRRRRRTD
jgi:DNA replication protein DnaC